MELEFKYSLRETTPEYRFADMVVSVPAQTFRESGGFGIPSVRLESGVIFTIKCSLAECGQYILKRVCELCITVSNFLRRTVVRALDRAFRCVRRENVRKTTTYLSCCVFRC